MKNLYLLFILLYSTSLIYAQESFQRNTSTSSREVKRLDNYEYQSWDETSNQWKKTYKDEYLYDNNFNLIQTLKYDRTKADTWELSSRYNYYYDQNGNLSEYSRELISLKDIIGEEYIYDENRNLITVIYYKVDPDTNQKNRGASQLKYTYYENGLVKEEISYDSDEDKITDKKEYVYDDRGNKIQILDYYLKSENDWVVSSKTEYTYDSHNNSTSHKQYVLDPSTEKLDTKPKNRSMQEYYYNNDDLLEKELFMTWDKDNNNWKTNSGKKYKYDISGNLTETIFFDGNDENSVSIRDDYAFSDSYDKKEMILPAPDFFNDFFLFEYNNIPTNYIRYSWDSKSDGWKPSSMYTYKYSTQEITSLVSSQAGSMIYPNPATEYINIRIPERKEHVSFELFDLQGKKIMEKYVENQGSVDMANLNSGVYFYTLSAENYYHKGKIVKR